MLFPAICSLSFVTFAFKINSVKRQAQQVSFGLGFRLSLVGRWLFLLLLFFAFLLSPVLAQHQPGKKTKKFFEQAKVAYQAGNILEAQAILQKVLKRDTLFAEAYFLQGDVFASAKQPAKAVGSYRKALALDSVSYPQAFYILAHLEFQSGDYLAALHDVRHFLKISGGLGNTGAEKLLQKAAFAVKAVQNPENIRLTRLNSQINTPADEYINFVNADENWLVFTRKVPEKKNGKTVYAEHFFSSVKTGKRWQKPKKMHFPWDSTLNMGAMSLSVDGRTMYFTGCYWPGGYGRCDIYVSRKLGNTWQFPRHLDRKVNTPSWDSQAVISSDGKRLFFASKRPGGKGGSDIWMCVRQSNGLWGKAVDLSDSINTPGNEMAPFLHADGRTLYFSSDGRTGMGGYDLYVSREDKGGHWSKAVNLGYPINTKANEINLFVSVDGRRAWLSSDRNTGNYDIYSFPLYDGVRPGRVLFVKGVVTDAHTGKKLSAKVVLTNLSTGRPVDSVVSDPVSGQFLVILHAGTDYAFHILKKGYLMYSQHFDLITFPHLISINKNFALKPVSKGNVMRLHNILFDFDRATLRDSAFPELNRLIRFLKENPRIHILIAGYTDNIGSKAYNLKLSQARAKAVFDYLVLKGIAAGRMTYQGFGSSHPVAGNQTAEGRAANRRTEIVIK